MGRKRRYTKSTLEGRYNKMKAQLARLQMAHGKRAVYITTLDAKMLKMIAEIESARAAVSEVPPTPEAPTPEAVPEATA